MNAKREDHEEIAIFFAIIGAIEIFVMLAIVVIACQSRRR